MIDFDKMIVRRQKDRASPTNESIWDRLRRWNIERHLRIKLGKHVTFKEKFKVSVCEGGNLDIGDHSFFHAKVWLLLTKPNPTVKIGKWVFVGRDTIIAAKNSISIGDFTIFAPRCYVVDHEHGFAADDLILNQQSQLKEIIIGKDCYFGTGTIILGGVTVGDGAVIGAGSIVAKDIPPYQIWTGNPARYIKDRK